MVSGTQSTESSMGRSFIQKVLLSFRKINREIDDETLEHNFSPKLGKYFVENVLGYSGNEFVYERNRTDVTLLDENKNRAVVIETKRPKEDLNNENWKDQAGKYADTSTRFVALTNGYRFLLWEIVNNERKLKVDINFKGLIISRMANEANLSTRDVEQILFLGNLKREQIWSEAKYNSFDQFYAKIDVSEEEGFNKLIKQLDYISNDVLTQFTYSAFDEYYAGYEQYKQTKDELEEIKKQTSNKKQSAEIARYELKTEGKYKKYADFVGYYIWRTLSNRSDNKEEDNKETFCKESVYVLISRLLFIRICEDKGLLSKKISNGGIEKLREQLFEPALPENGVFKQIVFFSYNSANNLYYHFYEKNNPLDWYENGDGELDRVLNRVLWVINQFDFAKVNRDVLGRLYEKYLPKEERKALGEFYTPDKIIEYILDSVGYLPNRAIEEKDIIDPACGSGGFLVRAARRLIARQVVKLGKATPKEALDNWPEVCDRLTPKECEEIINSVALHLHGFDINPFAASITEMNLLFQVIDLYFKAAKGNRKFKVPRFRVYETDSLEVTDGQPNLIQYYNTTGKNLAKDKEQIDENKRKKYDFVVGNPPYIRIQKIDQKSREIYSRNFVTAKGNYDIYIPFIELGIKLLGKNGKLGYICSNQFFKRDYGRTVRRFILSNSNVLQIVNFKDSGIFEDATNYPAIIILSESEVANTLVVSVDSPNASTLDEIKDGTENANVKRFEIDLKKSGDAEWILEDPEERNLMNYFDGCSELGSLAGVVSGVQTGADRIYLGELQNEDNDLFEMVGFKNEKVRVEKGHVIPFLLGRQVRRWKVDYGKKVAVFPYFKREGEFLLPEEKELKKKAPLLMDYLSKKRSELDRRIWYGQTATQLQGEWFGYMYFRPSNLTGKMIVTPALTDNLRFAPVERDVLFALGTAGVFGIVPKSDFYFILGLLNSSLITFAIKRMAPEKRGGYFQINSKVLSKVPIKVPKTEEEKEIVAKINEKVKEILKVKKDDKETGVTTIQDEIDTLVFDLYEVPSNDRRSILSKVN